MAKKAKITRTQPVAGFRAIAVVAAISTTGEIVAVDCAEGLIDAVIFKKYLKKLFRIYKGSPLHIYLDNLSFHRNAEVKDLCSENDCERCTLLRIPVSLIQ